MKVKTCLRFPGGKFYGFKHIKPYFQIQFKEYREPFVGGGSVFLGNDLTAKKNWINDVDKDLINFYKVIQNEDSKKELFHLLNDQIATKERHLEIKNYKPKNKIERAFRFFYLNRTSFSGIMVKPRWGYMLGSSVTPDHWAEIIEPVSKKLEDVKITCVDWKDVIKTKSQFDDKDVLLYLDPPYYNASKNIYNNEFTEQEHITLCNELKKTKFNFVLSYNDNPDIENMYNWANIEKVNWKYFMSEGRRQKGFELLISNYKINQKISEFKN